LIEQLKGLKKFRVSNKQRTSISDAKFKYFLMTKMSFKPVKLKKLCEISYISTPSLPGNIRVAKPHQFNAAQGKNVDAAPLYCTPTFFNVQNLSWHYLYFRFFITE
jgi:hypothetical protein